MSKKNYLILLLISFLSYSQDTPINYDFKKIDEISRKIEYNNDINALTLKLTENYTTQLEKTRAIFIWITDNIKYDCKRFNKLQKRYNPKVFKCKTKEECELKKSEYENQQILKTLNKKKGICGDYAMLFERMCSIVGVKCYYINGYTKTEAYQVGKMGLLDHAWNVVVIDDKYYYFDATWASGGCSKNEKGKLKKFHKNFNEYFWMTPIDKLSRNHFPKDTTWIKNSIYTKKLFKNNPYIHNSIISKIEISLPETGVINAQVGDTIKFMFKYKNKVDKIQINTNATRNPKVWIETKNTRELNVTALKKQKYITYVNTNETISFYYVVEKKTINFIEILFDYELALKYRIKLAN
ncbi:transglutaminase domain-containing protein [Flavobacterium sp. SUN052]|uniref:transglutaminase domain-containing protein n=1 Tax=Flavobacterium sp. SUN052 TaxID=3002441 RepID=UPI00237EC7FD|nr:transglutaminase domain-containing protein [Flavobacterium sp. SUN052]MEC4003299.1 transglutaminase domain-containing protein [Flavobacterium sp. SUN052]